MDFQKFHFVIAHWELSPPRGLRAGGRAAVSHTGVRIFFAPVRKLLPSSSSPSALAACRLEARGALISEEVVKLHLLQPVTQCSLEISIHLRSHFYEYKDHTLIPQGIACKLPS